MEQPISLLQQAKEILAARGLKPIDYKHMTYDQIIKLAGLKK